MRRRCNDCATDCWIGSSSIGRIGSLMVALRTGSCLLVEPADRGQSRSGKMEWLTNPEIWASLLALTALEIVLGIDNLVFIAILAGRLPSERQNQARRVGLALALITRLALLASIAWIIGLTRPVFNLLGHPVSWRDIVLVGGGFFLLYKGTREIHHRFEQDDLEQVAAARSSFTAVVAQIVLLDVVFSLDSVITAVGMANEFWVMAGGGGRPLAGAGV